MNRVGGEQKGTKEPNTKVGLRGPPFSQMRRQKLEGKKNHYTSKDIEKDIGDPVTHRIEFPQPVIDGVTEHTDRLISVSLFGGE
jgi:hypothetical protein